MIEPAFTFVINTRDPRLINFALQTTNAITTIVSKMTLKLTI